MIYRQPPHFLISVDYLMDLMTFLSLLQNDLQLDRQPTKMDRMRLTPTSLKICREKTKDVIVQKFQDLQGKDFCPSSSKIQKVFKIIY